MMLEWSVIKYVPDVWRFEPRNIGVMIRGESTVAIRFFAESEPGKIDGRSLRRLSADSDSYREWVRYFRRKLDSGCWHEVLEAQRRRPDFQYIVADGGRLFDSAGIGETLDELFREMVIGPDPDEVSAFPDETDGSTDNSRKRILRIFSHANLSVVEGIRVPAIFKGPHSADGVHQEVSFGYGYTNGRRHLFEAVGGRSNAYTFFAKAEAAYNADRSVNLLAMYPSSKFRNREAELRVIETFGSAIDIDDEESATRSVRELVADH